MEFDWDDVKARANRVKHRVGFEEASSAFFDPFRMTGPDVAHSDVEERELTIGYSDRLRVLVVVTTQREENVLRIISARKAERHEVLAYEENRRKAQYGR